MKSRFLYLAVVSVTLILLAEFTLAQEISDRGAFRTVKRPTVESVCEEPAFKDPNSLVVAWAVDPRDEIARIYSRAGFLVKIIQHTEVDSEVLSELKTILEKSPVGNIILSMHGGTCTDEAGKPVSYLFPGPDPDPYLVEIARNGRKLLCSEVERRTHGIKTTAFLDVIADSLSDSLESVIVDACFQLLPAVDFPVLV